MTGQISPRLMVLVLGVHRSGTSVLTSAMVAMGFQGGGFTDFVSAENPEGFHEHPDFRAFNDRLLAAFGASWDNWGLHAGTVAARLPELGAWLTEAAALLQTRFTGQAPAVLKDPRIGVLLPFWRQAVAMAGFRLGLVLMVRDPAEVAQSQVSRARSEPAFYAALSEPAAMAALWAVTMQGILRYLPDEGALVLRHRDLMHNPLPGLRAIAEAFLPATSDATLQAAIAAAIRPALYRERAPGGHLPSPGWPQLAQGLFDALWTGAPSPFQLTSVEAERRLLAVPGLANQIETLESVRASIAGSRRVIDQIAHLQRGLKVIEAALRRGKDPALLGELDTALGALPDTDSAEILLLRATIAQRLGRLDDALALLRRLTVAQPDHKRGWLVLLALLGRLGQDRDAAVLRAQLQVRFPGALSADPKSRVQT